MAKRQSPLNRVREAIQHFLRPETDPEQMELRQDYSKGGKAVATFPAPVKRTYRKKTEAEKRGDLESFGHQVSPQEYRQWEAGRAKAQQRQKEAAQQKRMLT